MSTQHALRIFILFIKQETVVKWYINLQVTFDIYHLLSVKDILHNDTVTLHVEIQKKIFNCCLKNKVAVKPKLWYDRLVPQLICAIILVWDYCVWKSSSMND